MARLADVTPDCLAFGRDGDFGGVWRFRPIGCQAVADCPRFTTALDAPLRDEAGQASLQGAPCPTLAKRPQQQVHADAFRVEGYCLGNLFELLAGNDPWHACARFICRETRVARHKVMPCPDHQGLRLIHFQQRAQVVEEDLIVGALAAVLAIPFVDECLRGHDFLFSVSPPSRDATARAGWMPTAIQAVSPAAEVRDADRIRRFSTPGPHACQAMGGYLWI